MIIESAFYRLPEIWADGSKPSGERDIASDFRHHINLHLDALQLGHESSIDKAYVINKEPNARGPKLTSDVYIKIANTWNGQSLPGIYLIQKETWVELKYYRPSRDQNSVVFNKIDLEKIKQDILKLCALVKEWPGQHRYNSRYFCAVFYSSPNNENNNMYSPIEFVKWLEYLLHPGLNSCEMAFELSQGKGNIRLKIDTLTYRFGPLPTANIQRYSYWGYLLRVFGFELFYDGSDQEFTGLRMTYKEPDSYLSQQDVQTQEKLGRMIIKDILSD